MQKKHNIFFSLPVQILILQQFIFLIFTVGVLSEICGLNAVFYKRKMQILSCAKLFVLKTVG